MIIAGLKLTFLGMGVVFLFLLLLILLVKVSYRFLAVLSAKELAEIEAAEIKRRNKAAFGTEDKVLVAIISAAIAAHRARA